MAYLESQGANPVSKVSDTNQGPVAGASGGSEEGAAG